jgi:hypothetical protein
MLAEIIVSVKELNVVLVCFPDRIYLSCSKSNIKEYLEIIFQKEVIIKYKLLNDTKDLLLPEHFLIMEKLESMIIDSVNR